MESLLVRVDALLNGVSSNAIHFSDAPFQARKASLDGALWKLAEKGQLRPEHVPRMEWDYLEARVLTWRSFAKMAVRALLMQERKLCNFVFDENEQVSSCHSFFAECLSAILLSEAAYAKV